MTDNRPIGIFDSGLGGLTVAKEIYQLLPHESTIYLGDTARVPYGNRSPKTITNFAIQAIQFLIQANVKAIVIACGTVSSVSLPSLRRQFPTIHLIGVIEPTARDALSQSKQFNIGVIGTNATIKSQAFEKTLKSINPKVNVVAQSCPLFVPIIEEGITHNHPIINETIKYYLADIKKSSIDTLILGCTHYPLITTPLKQFLPHINLVNPGISVANHLQQILTTQRLLSNNQTTIHTYYLTDKNDTFEKVATLFLGEPITATQISL